MFDGLKKKLADAVKSFIKTEKEERVEEKIEEKKIAEPVSIAREEERETVPAAKEEKRDAVAPVKVEEKKAEPIHIVKEEKRDVPATKEKEHEEEKKENLIKISLKTKIKSVFVSTIKLNDSDIDKFMEMMRMSMLQSDVSYGATEEILNGLRVQLKETGMSSRNIEKDVNEMIRNSLLTILSTAKPVDIMQVVKTRIAQGERPVKILFLGPNGTGKTTTIAKLAYGFKKAEISCVLSASDTFRAAAIEQITHHANAIGVPVIKSKYGADPASIAFDAIAYAKAHNLDAVLIDSAGRQETNKSLIEEMKKMVRISNPDLIIFVGESTAGNAVSEQISEFGKFMKIDGIILTKLDCDAKGGGVLSIVHATGKPVLFFGTGEGYDALVPYTPDFVIDAILPNT